MKYMNIVSGLVACTLLLCSGCQAPDTEIELLIRHLRKVYPEAVSLERLKAMNPDDNIRTYSIFREKEAMGYLAVVTVSSRSGPFDVMVVTNTTAKIEYVSILHYPHKYGRGVQSMEFTHQFVGKNSNDSIRLNEDIDGISGATISCKVVADGIRTSVRTLAGRISE